MFTPILTFSRYQCGAQGFIGGLFKPYLSKQEMHMSFWGERALTIVHLSWSLTVLVGCSRREPLRFLLSLQGQAAGSTAGI